jgi:hypothetical protein
MLFLKPGTDRAEVESVLRLKKHGLTGFGGNSRSVWEECSWGGAVFEWLLR